jgi:hypothetical protein
MQVRTEEGRSIAIEAAFRLAKKQETILFPGPAAFFPLESKSSSSGTG